MYLEKENKPKFQRNETIQNLIHKITKTGEIDWKNENIFSEIWEIKAFWANQLEVAQWSDSKKQKLQNTIAKIFQYQDAGLMLASAKDLTRELKEENEVKIAELDQAKKGLLPGILKSSKKKERITQLEAEIFSEEELELTEEIIDFEKFYWKNLAQPNSSLDKELRGELFGNVRYLITLQDREKRELIKELKELKGLKGLIRIVDQQIAERVQIIGWKAGNKDFSVYDAEIKSLSDLVDKLREKKGIKKSEPQGKKRPSAPKRSNTASGEMRGAMPESSEQPEGENASSENKIHGRGKQGYSVDEGSGHRRSNSAATFDWDEECEKKDHIGKFQEIKEAIRFDANRRRDSVSSIVSLESLQTLKKTWETLEKNPSTPKVKTPLREEIKEDYFDLYDQNEINNLVQKANNILNSKAKEELSREDWEEVAEIMTWVLKLKNDELEEFKSKMTPDEELISKIEAYEIYLVEQSEEIKSLKKELEIEKGKGQHIPNYSEPDDKYKLSLEEANKKLEEEKKDLERQNSVLIENQSRNEKQVKNLEGEINGFNQKVADLSKNLENKNAEIEKLKGNLADKDRELETKTEENKGILEQYNKATSEKEKARNQIKNLEERFEELMKSLISVQEQRNQFAETKKKLEENLSKEKDKNKGFEELKIANEVLRQLIEEQQQEKSNSNYEPTAGSPISNSLDKELRDIKNENAAQEKEINNLKTDLENAKKDLLSKEKTDFEQKLKNLTDEFFAVVVSEGKEADNSFEGLLLDLRNKIRNLVLDKKEIESKISGLRIELDTTRRERDNLKIDNDDLNKKNGGLTSELAEVNEKLRKFNLEYNHWKEWVVSANRKLGLSLEWRNWEDKIADWKEKAEKVLPKVEQEKRDLASQINALENKLTEQAGSSTAEANEIKRLKTELDSRLEYTEQLELILEKLFQKLWEINKSEQKNQPLSLDEPPAYEEVIEEQIIKLQKWVNELNIKKGNYQTKWQNAKNMLVCKNKKMVELRNEIKQKEERISQLNNIIIINLDKALTEKEGLSQQIQSLETQKSELESNLAEIKQELEQADNFLEEEWTKNAILEDKIKSLKTKKKDYKGKFNQTKNDYNATQTKNKVLKGKNEDLEWKLEVRTNQRDRARNKLKELKELQKNLAQKAENEKVNNLALTKYENISFNFEEDQKEESNLKDGPKQIIHKTAIEFIDTISKTQKYLGIKDLTQIATYKIPKDKSGKLKTLQ
ncbi:MAG: hypothetical protein I3273_04595 [Candidatus Moeniiplasma glomeromycotorum]|nr:hypothetical protein [Candidatus Moeniiplasma glomeromycotorum]MCE8169374.1 hypothetical protein [Candidatus Moeniiplasma glomeromycotorum]